MNDISMAISDDISFDQQRRILDNKHAYAQQILRRIEAAQNDYSDDELSIRCKIKSEANNE